ncbi:MAG TPA: magnesium/cobalt transporter CorA [Candidatus Dormibacteraeota bacterium]|nr:magnesium/cobalt transporter CorA [Candidatus Dormibacteraeota bacterium]
MIVDCAVYREGRRSDGDISVHDAVSACRQPDAFVWIGLYEPTEDEFDSIRREFNLHELAVEDALHAHQRPKLEVYSETVFIVLKTARYVDPDEVVSLGEILIFLGPDFIITVRHGEASELHGVRTQLERQPELLEHGPGAVLHAIVDQVVDDYTPALAGLGQDIDEIENEVFSDTRTNPAERIYKLKRETLEFNKATGPLVEPVDRLARGHYELIHPEVRAYFRDVSDHLMRVHDQLDSYRDLLTSVLEANLAQVTVRQNQDVRTISAIVALLAVPTMIAAIYGMNFEHMPELGWTFGYPLVIGVMIVICILLYRWFKKVGWLE